MDNIKHLTNQEYLNLYIRSLDIVSGDRALAIANFDNKFLYISSGYQKLTGCGDVIGKTLIESKHPGYHYAEEIKAIVKKVDETGKSCSFFIIYHDWNQTNCCFQYRLSLLQHPHTQEKIGRISEIRPVEVGQISRILGLTTILSDNIFRQKFIGSNLGLDMPNPKELVQLTTREEEILFLLILGKPYKEISEIISTANQTSVTPATVASVVKRQLLKKFDVFSVDALVNKATANHSIKYIPTSLVKHKEGIFILEYGE